jgi:hypothetical protein
VAEEDACAVPWNVHHAYCNKPTSASICPRQLQSAHVSFNLPNTSASICPRQPQSAHVSFNLPNFGFNLPNVSVNRPMSVAGCGATANNGLLRQPMCELYQIRLCMRYARVSTPCTRSQHTTFSRPSELNVIHIWAKMEQVGHKKARKPTHHPPIIRPNSTNRSPSVFF